MNSAVINLAIFGGIQNSVAPRRSNVIFASTNQFQLQYPEGEYLIMPFYVQEACGSFYSLKDVRQDSP